MVPWGSRYVLRKGFPLCSHYSGDIIETINPTRSVGVWILRGLLPRKLTWNLKFTPFERKLSFQTFILGFHVSFRGSIVFFFGGGPGGSFVLKSFSTFHGDPRFGLWSGPGLLGAKNRTGLIFWAAEGNWNFTYRKTSLKRVRSSDCNNTRWWFQRFLEFSPLFGEDGSNLTFAYFSNGWLNHHLINHGNLRGPPHPPMPRLPPPEIRV